MKKLRPYLLFTPFLLFLLSCAAKTDSGTKVYYYSIVRKNSQDIKDSIYASSDVDAVDSTVRRYYQYLSEYNAEKKKVSNNIYITMPLEWHLTNKGGEYVSSVSPDEIQRIESKYKRD